MKNRKNWIWIQASVLFVGTIIGISYCATDIAYAATSTFPENVPYRFISFFPSSTLYGSQKAGEILLTVFEFTKKIVKIAKEVMSRTSAYAISGFRAAGDFFLSSTGISFYDSAKGAWNWLLWLLNWAVRFLKAIFSR